MKSLFSAEKLLALFLWGASLFLLGGIAADDVQQKPVQGKAEAAAFAMEMGSGWEEIAGNDTAAFIESAVTLCAE